MAEINSLSDLKPEQLNALETLARDQSATREDFVELISGFVPPESVSTIADQALQRFPYIPSPNKSQETSSTQHPPGLGAIPALLSTGFAFASLDRSKSVEIIDALNREQQEELFKKGGALERAIDTGDQKDIDAALRELEDPDVLLDRQVSSLVDQAGEEGKSLQEAHNASKKPNPSSRKEAKRQKALEREKKERARHQEELKKRLLASYENAKKEKERDPNKFAKGLKKSGLTEEEYIRREAQRERERLLRTHVGQIQNRNGSRIRSLITRNVLGGIFGQRSLFSRPTRDRLALPKKQEEESKEIVKPDVFLPIQIPQSAQPAFEEETSPGGPGIPNPLRILNLTQEGGGVTRLARAIPPQAWPWIIGIGIGLVILILIVVLIIYLLSLGGSPIVYTQLSCGDTDAINVSSSQESAIKIVDNQIEKYFNIHISEDISGNVPIIKALPIDQQIFNTVCILFGHTVTSPYDIPGNYNDFGNLVVGNKNQRQSGNPLLRISFVIFYDPAAPNCTIRPHNPFTQGQGERWDLLNPDTCGGYQLQFLIAQTLGYSLIDQQKYLKSVGDNSNKYSLFANDFQTGPFSTGRLPTIRCNNPPVDGHSQDKDCFADMVGEYAVYPWYLDGDSQKACPTVPGSPTPIVSLVFGCYTTDPSYSPYYNFAKNKLFNGIDFVSNQIASADIAGYGKYITDHLPTGCIPGYKNTLSPNPLQSPVSTGILSNYVIVMGGGGHECNSDLYWCTDLVIDAYNLAGINLPRHGIGLVDDMVKYFSTTKGFNFADYRHADDFTKSQIVQSLRPGNAIFEGGWGCGATHCHTGLIKDVQIDQRGNGIYHTYEANAGQTSYPHPISGWLIIDPHDIDGFGFFTGQVPNPPAPTLAP